MFCDKCKANKATVHFTKIINGKKTEQHLCEYCADSMDNTFTFDDMFKNVFNINPYGGYSREIGMKKCSSCGLTLDELNKTGKLGCSDCCEAFKEYIEPALRSFHSGTKHKGKRPGKSVSVMPKVDKKAELKTKLDEAIKNEEYEKAAEIRDILRSMEKEA